MKETLRRLSVEMKKKENLIYVLLCASAVIFLLLGIIKEVSAGGSPEKILERGEFGTGDRQYSLIAEVEFEGNTASENVDLSIGSQKLSEEEKKARLEECKKSLPEIILGDNSGADNIKSDLNLIGFHDESGVSLIWSSGRNELIGEDGRVYPGKLEDNGYVLLTARLMIEDMEEVWKCNVRHRLCVNADNFGILLNKSISDLKDSINGNTDGSSIVLPDKTDSGLKISWRNRKENYCIILAAVSLIAAIFIYSKRKSDRKATVIKRKEEIQTEFPYFLDKLVMLISAGLILSDAVERISDDYLHYVKPAGKKVLYEELLETVVRMKEGNASFSEELMDLSERLDVREFARLSVILRDSLESGISLADKLEEESALMLRERKSHVQRLGRTADTKLIFPLMLILSVLIIIVMAPAVMQM